jgi:hypothetical protein
MVSKIFVLALAASPFVAAHGKIAQVVSHTSVTIKQTC